MNHSAAAASRGCVIDVHVERLMLVAGEAFGLLVAACPECSHQLRRCGFGRDETEVRGDRRRSEDGPPHDYFFLPFLPFFFAISPLSVRSAP